VYGIGVIATLSFVFNNFTHLLVCSPFFVDLGLELRAYSLSHSTCPVLWSVSQTICLGCFQTMILLISASWVARIRAVSQWHKLFLISWVIMARLRNPRPWRQLPDSNNCDKTRFFLLFYSSLICPVREIGPSVKSGAISIGAECGIFSADSWLYFHVKEIKIFWKSRVQVMLK
jgi:hypothetical protein